MHSTSDRWNKIYFSRFIHEADRSADLRFSFIGDLHYKIPDYTISEYFVSQMSEELMQLIPKSEFAILSGDFYHGQKGTDIETEFAFSFKNFSENINKQFFIAKGNHDSRGPYEKNSLPIFSKEIDRSITKSYYSFDKAKCHFIMLDCTDKDLTEQIIWLEQDLEEVTLNFDKILQR